MANNHKYIKREMKNGRWVYYYADDLKSKKKTAANVSNAASAQANGRKAFVAAVNNNANKPNVINAAATNAAKYVQNASDQAKAQATARRAQQASRTGKSYTQRTMSQSVSKLTKSSAGKTYLNKLGVTSRKRKR